MVEFIHVGLVTFSVALVVIIAISLRYCICCLVSFFANILLVLSPQWKGKILFIIAHPDDECMFFGPSFNLVIRQRGPSNVHVLCLTNGNYYGQGKVREKELIESCSLFGLERGNIRIVNDPYFQDGDQHWDERRVLAEVIDSIAEWDISTIITFDKWGISGHPNHSAIYHVICGNKDILNVRGRKILCYFLESVNIFRKYISIYDLFYSIFHCFTAKFMRENKKLVFSGYLDNVNVTRNAMKRHKSQLIWFRKIYVIFSRYMVINTLDCREVIFDVKQ